MNTETLEEKTVQQRLPERIEITEPKEESKKGSGKYNVLFLEINEYSGAYKGQFPWTTMCDVKSGERTFTVYTPKNAPLDDMLKNIQPDMVLIPPGLEPKKALQYSSALRQKKIPHVYWQFGQDFDGREQKILLDVLADRVGLNTKNTKETYVNTEPNARFPKLNRYFAAYKI
ncbi:MAG TPA: hypothetical protein VI894_00955 [Candidatus Nanoarchaeia archaeon]|nr:hypothetical protein [Candidatus Nanoarchaeia archaeon]